jgi:hypothetical protein
MTSDARVRSSYEVGSAGGGGAAEREEGMALTFVSRQGWGRRRRSR